MEWDIDPIIFKLPWIDWPVRWYGLCFVIGLFLSYNYLLRKITKSFESRQKSHKEALAFTDTLFWYMMIGLIIGARLGHLIMYEPSFTFIEIFQTWKGGLASHGGAVGILLALTVFAYRFKKEREASFFSLLDELAIPVAITGFFIRLGNFFNQEILGIPSQVPWAITFLNPFDGSPVMPRHPAQLYEGFYYLSHMLVFASFPAFFKGRRTGFKGALMIFSCFTFRFFIEFIKERQSEVLEGDFWLNMGQQLSIPMIIIGAILLLYTRKKESLA